MRQIGRNTASPLPARLMLLRFSARLLDLAARLTERTEDYLASSGV